MRNLLFKISYNGSNYHGYQVQQNALAVAEVLQNAIEQVLKVREDIVGCSRTDTKVHANCFYFHMKTQANIPPERMVIAMNCHLPDDIAVLECIEVPLEFHARYHCIGKEYLYQIWNSQIKNPFLQNLAYHYPYPIDVEMLDQAGQALVGTHDFKAFCAAGGKEMETVRTIHSFSVTREKDMVSITICGDGFLYHMVRIIVGTLLEIQSGRIPKDGIADIIQSKNRRFAGPTARPEGLYLNRVIYGGEWFGKA